MPQIDCCNICFLTLAMHYLNNSSSFREMVSSKSSCLTILSLFSPSLQHQCTLSSFSNPFAIYSHHTFSQALTSSLPRMIVIICLLKFQVCTSTVSPTLLPRALAEFLININKATSVFSLKKSLFEIHLCHDATDLVKSSQQSVMLCELPHPFPMLSHLLPFEL